MPEAFLYDVGGGGPSTVLSAVTLSSNGTYYPSQFSVDGFDEVTVDIQAPAEDYFLHNITELSFSVPSGKSIILSDFSQCQSLARISITGDSSAKVGILSSAFYRCTLLSEVYIENAYLTSINEFAYCKNLLSVSLTIGSVGTASSLFYNCVRLKNLHLDFLNTNNRNIPVNAFAYCYTLESVSITTCSVISNSAFAGCLLLSSVNFSKTLKQILLNAFAGCYMLNSFSAASVQIISASAFQDCYMLKSVEFPMLTSTYSYAFQSCSLLSYADLGSRIIKIGDYTFSGCLMLSTLIIRTDEVCPLGTLALNATLFNCGQGSVLVKSSLVDTYKSYTNWVNYSSLIYSLQE